jgi:signal transduction histidine kinase
MLSFYTLPEAFGIIFNLLTIISAGFAAVVLVLHQFRFKHDLNYWLNGLASFLALCQTLINAALIARVQENMTYGYILSSGYSGIRYAVFGAAAALFIVMFIRNITGKNITVSARQALRPALVAAASFLTLPLMESWLGALFPAAYCAALALLLAGSIGFSLRLRRELKASISGLSVKQAMDSLGTAVLFYRKSGHILMQNNKMQELMLQTAGRVFFNGKQYLDTVVIPNAQYQGADIYLYKLPDGEWLFTVRQLKTRLPAITQLTATEVSGQNRINLLLKQKQDELNAQQERLKAGIEKAGQLRRSEELLRLQAEFHDAQNQKLTALLRYLRQGQWPPADILAAAGTSLVSGLQDSGGAADPLSELKALIGGYGQAGVKISVEGLLPSDSDIALTLVFVLREAAANAVIHGYASEVFAHITTEQDTVVLRITDNSALPPKEIREGSGIADIRRRLASRGGTLSIETAERFILTATVRHKEGERT